jgi:hypothetical protein
MQIKQQKICRVSARKLSIQNIHKIFKLFTLFVIFCFFSYKFEADWDQKAIEVTGTLRTMPNIALKSLNSILKMYLKNLAIREKVSISVKKS